MSKNTIDLPTIPRVFGMRELAEKIYVARFASSFPIVPAEWAVVAIEAAQAFEAALEEAGL